jgi:hypothetical protein
VLTEPRKCALQVVGAGGLARGTAAAAMTWLYVLRMDLERRNACALSPVEGFVRKIGETKLIDAFGRVVDDVKNFAMPALDSLSSGVRLKTQWKAGQGWVAVRRVIAMRKLPRTSATIGL